MIVHRECTSDTHALVACIGSVLRVTHAPVIVHWECTWGHSCTCDRASGVYFGTLMHLWRASGVYLGSLMHLGSCAGSVLRDTHALVVCIGSVVRVTHAHCVSGRGSYALMHIA